MQGEKPKFKDLYKKIEFINRGQVEVWKYIRIKDSKSCAVKVINRAILNENQKNAL